MTLSDAHQWTITVRAEPCEEYTDKSECEMANCYWYNESCHSEPQPGIPWPLVAGVIIAAAGGIAAGVYIWKRR